MTAAGHKQSVGGAAVAGICARLKNLYPEVHCELNYSQPHELLIAARLSAQCTDKRVNLVTPELFSRYKSIADFAAAQVDDVCELIKTCGLFKSKARDIVMMCQLLDSNYSGEIPDTLSELVKLPGVGRKTANLIIGELYNKPAIVVDTHVIRLSNRLGLAVGKNAHQIEKVLSDLLPPDEGMGFCHRLVWYGRRVCAAKRPRCGECVIKEFCAVDSSPKHTLLDIPQKKLLSKRLLAIAQLVRKGKPVCDVGTDHALVPCFLKQNGWECVFASDKNQKPLDGAKETMKSCGVEGVELILSDGLDSVPHYDDMDIIIAGMGGETIAEILKRHNPTKNQRFILQPMTKHHLLRAALCDGGYEILSETAVNDDKKHYTIIYAKFSGVKQEVTPDFLYIGKQTDKLYIKSQLSKLKKMARSNPELKTVIEEVELKNANI